MMLMLMLAVILRSIPKVTYMQVDEVKNIMVDNIEKVLERGEKIELLVDKTDNLRFQVQSVSVMSSAWQTLIIHSRKLQQAPAGGSVCICAGDVSHGLHKAMCKSIGHAKQAYCPAASFFLHAVWMQTLSVSLARVDVFK